VKIIFENLQQVEIEPNSSPLTAVFRTLLKHLQHVPLPYRDWDNPNIQHQTNLPQLIQQLDHYAKLLGIDLDHNACLNQSQSYFNHIHQVYENSYNGDPNWLSFHENLHRCEFYPLPWTRYYTLDYREKAGPLTRNIDLKCIEKVQTSVSAGDAFFAWAELGKNPYSYWRQNEPNNLERLCQLAKPWHKFVPKMCIALDDINFMPTAGVDEFELWWQNYEAAWCQHWNIKEWKLHNIYGVVVAGQVKDFDRFLDLTKRQIAPVYLKL
jgi:hypothetical protein